MNRGLLAGLALLLVVALGLRIPELSLRPLHSDEGVNAVKFGALYNSNYYKYNPDEFHGPTLPYFTLPAARLDGGGDFNHFNESLFRSVTVAFGAGLILLLLLVARDLGRAETLWAAAFTALSPAMVFYSRYYIHEMLLVFFTSLSFFSLWRLATAGRAVWAVTAGIGLGLMAATKETFVFAVAAMVLSAGFLLALVPFAFRIGSASSTGAGVIEAWKNRHKYVVPAFLPRWKWFPLIITFATAAGIAAIFFSSFLSNRDGLAGAFRTYSPWFLRAGGQTAHVHPWTFYFERLLWFHVHGGPVWSEGFVMLLAAAGFLAALARRVLLWRLIAFYTFWLTLIYTLLPYKTPWCLLGFYQGMILLAGLGAATIWRSCQPVWLKATVATLLAAGLVHLGWQSYLGNFASDRSGLPYCDSPKNPYTYSQTLPDALRLVSTVEELARVSPQGSNTVMEVMAPESYWPLPWYLRRFQKVGFWDRIPNQPLAPIMIVSTDLHANFDQRPEKTHLMAGYYELRPGVFLELYVRLDLWTSYVKSLPPEKD